MAHGTPIASIGIVKWRFHTGSTTITIRAHFYHAPNDSACLLIPQQLLSDIRGSTGTFTICDKCDTLSLYVKLSLHYEFLTPAEREDKHKPIQCEDHIHASYQHSQTFFSGGASPA